MTMSGSDLQISGEVTMTGDISTGNNKIVFMLTYDFSGQQEPDYFASVIEYSDTAFPLTSEGEQGTYTAFFPFDESWDLSKVTAVILVRIYYYLKIAGVIWIENANFKYYGMTQPLEQPFIESRRPWAKQEKTPFLYKK